MPTVSTIRKLSNIRSARTFSPQLGQSTFASGSAALVSREAPHAGQVWSVDSLDSAAIGSTVTSTIFGATLRSRAKWQFAGHDTRIDNHRIARAERRGAASARPISGARAAEIFAVAPSATRAERIHYPKWLPRPPSRSRA